jgi:RHS repeat-associated protein
MKQTQLSQQNRPKIKLISELRDNKGKLLIRVSKEISHLLWNRMTEIKNSETGKGIAYFIYDREGNRVYKETYNIDDNENNLSTYYIRGQSVEFVHNRITNGTIYNQTYLYLQDKLVAKIDNDNRKFFYHPDHLGSTTLVTNETGDVVEDISYLPFGDLLREMTGAEQQRFLYTGQEYDRESELLYYGARYYKPEFRRFLQADPIISDVYNPQNLNRYSYVLNNPYKYVDESGEFPVTVVAGLATGAVVGVIQGYITYQQTGDLNKAVTSGIISGGATALTVATFGAASTTAVAAGSGLRYVGSSATLTAFSGGVGAVESVAQQTLVQERSFSDISYTSVAISAGANSLGGSLSSGLGLPGVVSRSAGQFYPSTIGYPLGKEILSQTAVSGYSEFGEYGVKKLLGDELYYTNNNLFTPQTHVNEEGKGNQNNYDSSGSGGSFGSSAPPPGSNTCQISFACGYSGGGL